MMPQPPSLTPPSGAGQAPSPGVIELMQRMMASGGTPGGGAPAASGNEASAQAQALVEEIANRTKDLMLLAKAAFPNLLPYLAQFAKIGQVIQDELSSGPSGGKGSQETGTVPESNPAAA